MLAADRLALSRERLRLALRVDAAALAAASASPAWLDRLHTVPAAHIALQALAQWWARSPWRLAGRIGADAAQAVVKPVAQRHPWALVLGATAAGALFAWSRPWRWMLKPALFAGLLPQLARHSLKAAVPTSAGSWLSILAALAPAPVPARPQQPPGH